MPSIFNKNNTQFVWNNINVEIIFILLWGENESDGTVTRSNVNSLCVKKNIILENCYQRQLFLSK